MTGRICREAGIRDGAGPAGRVAVRGRDDTGQSEVTT